MADKEVFEEVNRNGYIQDLKPKAKSLELATRIVEQKADVTKGENGYDVNLMTVLGFRHESSYKKKADAVNEAATLLASELDSGALVLADDFEFQHGIKAKK